MLLQRLQPPLFVLDRQHCSPSEQGSPSSPSVVASVVHGDSFSGTGTALAGLLQHGDGSITSDVGDGVDSVWGGRHAVYGKTLQIPREMELGCEVSPIL